MTIDIDALESAAKAATPGPWEVYGDSNIEGYEIEADNAYTKIVQGNVCKFEDAVYIAAANPAVVLELVAELRAEREKYTNAVKAYKAVVQEAAWLAYQVYKPRRRCPPLQECNDDDIVTESDCQQCWIYAAREAVEKEAKE